MAVAVNRTYGYERPEVDAVYRSIAANPALGIIAGGGDSHGRETSQKMEATLGDGDFGGLRLYAGGHFCQGGMTAQRYEHSQFFNDMLASNSNICLILVGGTILTEIHLELSEMLQIQSMTCIGGSQMRVTKLYIS